MKEVGDSSSTRPVTTQTIANVETGIIWKPHIVDGRGHHVLDNHNSLMNPAIVLSISMAWVLPVDVSEVKNLSDDQLLLLSDSSSYMVSIWG